VRGKGKREEWEGLGSKELMVTRLREGREETPAFATAAAELSLGGISGRRGGGRGKRAGGQKRRS
jgi:hypothetical protein